MHNSTAQVKDFLVTQALVVLIKHQSLPQQEETKHMEDWRDINRMMSATKGQTDISVSELIIPLPTRDSEEEEVEAPGTMEEDLLLLAEEVDLVTVTLECVRMPSTPL